MRNCHSSFTAAIQLTPIDPNDRIDKVRNFVNILDKNFQQMLIPGTHLSIDEAMITYNGRLYGNSICRKSQQNGAYNCGSYVTQSPATA